VVTFVPPCSTYFTLGPVPPSYLALSWIIILLNVAMMVTFLYQLLRVVRTTVLLKVGVLRRVCVCVQVVKGTLQESLLCWLTVLAA
jgi:hypothetical protein